MTVVKQVLMQRKIAMVKSTFHDSIVGGGGGGVRALVD